MTQYQAIKNKIPICITYWFAHTLTILPMNMGEHKHMIESEQ